jgi:hypothetical protein
MLGGTVEREIREVGVGVGHGAHPRVPRR